MIESLRTEIHDLMVESSIHWQLYVQNTYCEYC